jgi:hypothetical protein
VGKQADGCSRGATHKDDLEEHLLVNLHELLVPLVNVGGLLPVVVVIIGRLGRIVAVVLAPLNHLAQDRVVHVGNGNRAAGNSIVTQILDEVLDEHGPLGDHAICHAVRRGRQGTETNPIDLPTSMVEPSLLVRVTFWVFLSADILICGFLRAWRGRID